jgi:GR25 family glycosyltransferase involved in LPS biosynthesis
MSFNIENPFSYFDKSYYINLDHRADRKEEILSELYKYKIYPDRFSAISLTKEESDLITKNGGATWDHNHFIGHMTKEQLDNKTRAQRSCTMSHIGVIKLAKKLDLKNVLIFEDDAIFYSDIDVKNIVHNALQELDSIEWDIFSLGCNPVGTMTRHGNYLAKLTQYYVSHAVVVNHTAYDKIINFHWNRHIVIDQFFLAETFAGNLKSYTTTEPLAYQRKSFSDIEFGYFWGDGTTKDLLRDGYKKWMV